MNTIKAYACYNKNKKIVNNSSSGGVFYVIASHFITELSGSVYGAIIQNGNVFHSKATTLDEMLPMLGSKYVKSNLNNTFSQCKNDLENNKHVLFSGTPCQINALYLYLEKHKTPFEKLICVDTICHGTPKRKYWEQYLSLNFKNQDISDISFRYKKHGWEEFYIKIGKYESPIIADPYMLNFLNNRILDESCFNCSSKGDNRKADITLGDFWSINQIESRYKNKNGTSLIIIRKNHIFLTSILKKMCIINEVPFIDSVFLYNYPYYKSVTKNNKEPILDTDLLIAKKRKNRFSLKKQLNQVKNSIARFKSFTLYGKNSIYANKKNKVKNNRIGIITLYGYYNYGNRLQNYALIKKLQEQGKKPYNIYYLDKPHHFYRLLTFGNTNRPYQSNNKIVKACKLYERNVYYRKTKLLEKRLCNFETIIIGSDQVWNPSCRYYENDLDMFLGNLRIINKPYKLTSYASSLCLEELSVDYQFLFKHSLDQFDSISVREKSSEKLLSELGITATTVLDPVFLLSDNEWETVIKKYSTLKIPNTTYDFKYLLGSKDDCYMSNNAIVELSFGKANQFDFINYIKHANNIITNSFHCVAFSIIFKKKVMIVERNDSGMNNRINDLFNLFGLPITYNKFIDFSNLDYSKLIKEKEKSMNYLINIIK